MAIPTSTQEVLDELGPLVEKVAQYEDPDFDGEARDIVRLTRSKLRKLLEEVENYNAYMEHGPSEE
jgi:hypothetical protein